MLIDITQIGNRGYIPVNNAIFVQILQSQNDASGIKDGTRFPEDISMYVHHEITTGCVLHYETYMCLQRKIHFFYL